MPRITTITNQKGGVGKTTTAHALTAGLSFKGYKVLLMDMDPQGNISYTMRADTGKAGIYEVLKGGIKPQEAIQHTRQGDIIASSLLLTGADMEFTQTGREYLLKNILGPIKDNYDFIIIDTPPQLGILTINALTASDDIIIPMGADIYSLQGLAQLHDTIKKIRQYCNSKLIISGLLMTRYNGRLIISRDLKESIQAVAAQIGATVYKNIIREGIAIKEAQAQQVSIFENTKSNPARDYLLFIDEYLKQRGEVKNND
jgi:chromosome partitioning protein